MQITRRRFIAATAAASLVPVRGWAASSLRMGNIRIDTLSDGYLTTPIAFSLGDVPLADAAPILTKYGLGTEKLDRPCNVTLLRDGTNTVLFDVGSGPDFMPSAGKIMDAFNVLGVIPDDITHVVFTHAHQDHIGGLLDDFDDPLFANAEHLIGRGEHAYWVNPETVNTISAARTTMAVGAKRRLEIVDDTITTFGDGDDILLGISALATHGHTPGHMSFFAHDGSDTVLIAGDVMVDHHLAFERPGWHSGADQDPEMGAATRIRLLDRLASDQMVLVGFHLPGGGIGRAERSGDGYIYVGAGT